MDEERNMGEHYERDICFKNKTIIQYKTLNINLFWKLKTYLILENLGYYFKVQTIIFIQILENIKMIIFLRVQLMYARMAHFNSTYKGIV